MRQVLQVIQRLVSIACVVGLLAGSATALLPSSAAAQSADREDGALRRFEAGRILVKFKVGVSEADREALLAEHGLEQLRDLLGLNVGLLQTEEGSELSVVEALNASPLVEYAEPDYIYQAFETLSSEALLSETVTPALVPNDPLYGDQWGLAKINAPGAWDFTTGSANVTIAVLDSGVDLSHPDLTPKFTSGYNAIFALGLPQDRDGHGTHVAGIAAGATNNGTGTAGTAWGARIMPVKALTRFGGSTSNIAEGIVWATDNGANVINMSLGGTQNSTTLHSAVQYAYARNVLLVAAMGNEFQTGNFTNYPAAYAEVMAVAATDRNDQHASFSNSGNHVEVSAPGVDILSTYRAGTVSTYTSLSGTSMSTPFVSGLAALLFSVNPSLTAADVRAIIIISSTDVGAPGWDSETGWGRIDALTAMIFAVSGFTAADLPESGNGSAPTTPTVELDRGIFLPIAAY